MTLPPHASAGLRLLHYWWPVVMGASATMIVHRATGRAIDGPGLGLLLFGILAAYSVDRLVDTTRAQSASLTTALRSGAIAGMSGGAVLLLYMPVRTALLVPVIGALVLVYRRLKTLPVLKTIVVAVVWTWSLIALPFPDGSWLGWQAWTVPVAVPIALLMASGCLLCDLKDVRVDRVASVRSLPVLLGVNRTIVIAITCAGLGAAVALVEQRLGLWFGGLGLAVLASRPAILARDVVGPLMVDVILTVPGLLVVLHLV